MATLTQNNFRPYLDEEIKSVAVLEWPISYPSQDYIKQNLFSQ